MSARVMGLTRPTLCTNSVLLVFKGWRIRTVGKAQSKDGGVEVASRRRLPFKIERMILHARDGYAYVRIFHPDSNPTGRMQVFGSKKWEIYEMAERWPNLPADLGRFFHQHGSCAYCGKPIAVELTACDCVQAKGAVHLRIRFPVDNIPEYKRLTRNEAYRIVKERRNTTLSANGGSHTTEEIEGLFLAQKGCCYYCAKSLKGESGERRYHRDHYVPVIEGGDNSIENIVLACPECNIDKGGEKGSWYETRHPGRGRRNAKTRKLLEEIHAGRAAFLALLRGG
ncbi:MAG TPA: HNH endonuclease signature motif containing protein [Thiobacillaceae bacterium]|nr:HNH endonuclease signature motif containing protein [Thiobacillaceae bacterium]